IGVNDYLDPNIAKLKYSVADANLVYRTLTEGCGYEADRVLLMTDDSPKAYLRPLRINLEKQLPRWLEDVRAGDTVVIYFSGHGFLDDKGESFLAPQDCDRKQVVHSGLRAETLRDLLRDCPATQKLLVLDCCHAGGKAAGTVGLSGQEL